MFIDTEFSNGTNASRAFELRYVDTPGTRKERGGWRRKLKRTERDNVRTHIAGELFERARDADGWTDMELADYETAMATMERDERVTGFETGEWSRDDDEWDHNDQWCDICQSWDCRYN